MKYKSALTTQASGSLRGITASHNRGGQYLRGRTIPTNPSTALQVVIRNAMKTAVNLWMALTGSQRDAWKVYADNTPTTDSLGDALVLTGQQAYVRSEIVRIQTNGTDVSNAPTEYNFGAFTFPTLTLTPSSTSAVLHFDGGDAWTNSTANYLAVYTSPPQSPSINFYKGPYQLAGKVNGTAGSANMTLPIAAGVAGQQTFFRVTLSQADGRLSNGFPGSSIA